MNLTELKNILINFREALETYNGIQHTINEHDLNINDIMRMYPRTCCSYVCKFLGHYLKYDLLIDPIVYCTGTFENGGHHDWLKYKDYFIDLTLDQFDDSLPKVLLSFQSDYHKSKINSTRESEGLLDFKHWSDSEIKYYSGLVDFIKKQK